MKIYSALQNPLPLRFPDLENDNPEQKKVKRLYQDPAELKRLLSSAMMPLFFISVGIVQSIYLFYHLLNKESFFYPCNYLNMISLNEALLLQNKMNLSQNNSESATLIIPSITTDETSYEYHKINWKKCFTHNLIQFNQKVVFWIYILSIICIIVILYQLGSLLYRILELKRLNLREDEATAYKRKWIGFDGDKTNLFIKGFTLCSCFASMALWSYISPANLPKTPIKTTFELLKGNIFAVIIMANGTLLARKKKAIEDLDIESAKLIILSTDIVSRSTKKPKDEYHKVNWKKFFTKNLTQFNQKVDTWIYVLATVLMETIFVIF